MVSTVILAPPKSNKVQHQIVLQTSIISTPSLVTSACTPPGEKRSGKQSQISWAYYPKAVRTNEIARSVIIT